MVGGEEVGSAYVSIGVQLDESTMSAAKSKFSSAVSDMSSGIGGLRSSLGSELSASMSGIASSMGPVGGALSAIGPAGIAAGAGIAVVGSALSSSVTTAAGFQQQMAGVAAIMGSSGAELEAMSSAAREAGASTQFSASQAAEALSYMAGAGWDSQQATAGLKDTLTMAAAGGMDLASAGDLMTNTIAQFNLEATNSGQVANTLAAGAAETNTNIAQLGGGLKEVGATAAAFGMSLESTTAALGALSNAGIKGAEGGTALRGILAGLASQSKPAAEALAELGISAEQINPATVGVADAMELLNEKGMTATQALKIFGRENVSAATYLAAHASSLDGLETSITGTSKATEMAAIQTDTYLGALGEFSSAVEEAQITVGTLLLPTLTDLTKVFTGLINATTKTGGFIGDFASGVSDSISTAFSGGSLADIDEAFLSALGVDTGKEAGDQLAEGVAESDDLKAAPGEALGSPEALNKIGDAADEAGATYADRFSELVKSGISKEIAGWMATDLTGDLTDKMALALINAQTKINGDDRNEAGLRKTTLKSGLEVELKYQTDDGLTRSTLLVNGQEVAGPVSGWGIEKTLPELFRRAGLDYDEANVLDLTNRLGEAAILRATDTREIVVDSFLDVSTGAKSEIQAAGQTIADAFTKGLKPDKAQIDASLESLRNLKLYDPEDAKAQGADNAIAYLDALSDAIESYDEAKAKYLVEPDNDRAKDDLIRTRDNLQDILDQNPLTVNLFGNVKKESFDIDISKAISSMEELTKVAGTDYMEFLRNTWQPALQSELDWYADAWHSGVLDMQRQSATYLGDLVNKAREMPDLFTGEQIEALRDYAKGLIDVGEALDRLNGKAETTNTALGKLAETPKAATVGYNQLQKAVEDCEACLMSDFGAWQESQENLFNPSYIGQGGQAYLDWKNTVVGAANEAAMAMNAVGGAALGSIGQTQQSIPVSVKLDTSAATSALTEFEGTAKKDVQKPLIIDSTKATASISEVDTAAQKEVSKSLRIDTSAAMSAIASINAAASQPVYKTVYVNEVYTGSSGGGGGGGAGSGYLGDYMLPPIFMARGGYVSRPTLAVVGEAGPEYVIPAENMAKGLSRMGGGGDVNITINSPITGSGQDIEALLAQRNKELVAEITEQIASARRGL